MVIFVKVLVKVLETLTCGNWIIEENMSHLRAVTCFCCCCFAFNCRIIGLKWQGMIMLNMLPGLLQSMQLAGHFAEAGYTLMEGLWQLQNMATEWMDNGQIPVIPTATVRRGGFGWALPSSITLEGTLHSGWHQASGTLAPHSAMICGMTTWKRTCNFPDPTIILQPGNTTKHGRSSSLEELFHLYIYSSMFWSSHLISPRPWFPPPYCPDNTQVRGRRNGMCKGIGLCLFCFCFVTVITIHS